mmetsp:Transcript_10377/g.38500  ORF Transcript_10377/g.38500 Transcript_10377/m.38500 type:complete len:85 (+) Transcript_10377:2617-2871(+)
MALSSVRILDKCDETLENLGGCDVGRRRLLDCGAPLQLEDSFEDDECIVVVERTDFCLILDEVLAGSGSCLPAQPGPGLRLIML